MALLAWSFGCAPGATDEPAPAPSIVVVDIDTLRADHLGCYGYSRATSPTIDRLAQESVLFEWAFSQAPNTLPSQMSILSSLYPTTHGMLGGDDRVPEEAVMLAEVFADHGYATAAFVDGGYLRRRFGMDRGFGVYDDAGGGLKQIGPKAIEWLRRHRSQPLLLLVHTYDVHTPYDPPEPYRSLFTDGIEPTPGFHPDAQTMEEIRLSVWKKEVKTLPQNDLAYAKALYDGGIRYVDDWVAELRAELARLRLDRRTFLVVVSDHGEEFGEHGSVLHEKLYGTVTRIPLIIRPPGGGPPRRVPSIVEAVDLMPTLLELADLPSPSGLQGESLAALMGGERAGRRVAFGESPFFGRRRYVAEGDHRLLLTRRNGKMELYDFRRDPMEQEDLSGREPERVQHLRSTLDRWQRRMEQERLDSQAVAPMDEETRRQLRALGYIR